MGRVAAGTPRGDWWTRFFGREVGRIMFGPARWAHAAREADVVIRRARLRRGMRVLDLACGTGRHVIAMARRGLVVTGLDYSRAYVAEARERTRRAGLAARARIVRGDMRKLDRAFPPGSFDAVVSLFNSFGYFASRREDAAVLRGAARVLTPGGALVLNTLNRPGVEARLATLPGRLRLDGLYSWTEHPGRGYFLQRTTWNARTRRTDATWIVVEPRRRRARRFRFAQNVYTPAEFGRLLRPMGLRIEALWGMLGGGPYRADSWHQTFVARKRGAAPAGAGA